MLVRMDAQNPTPAPESPKVRFTASLRCWQHFRLLAPSVAEFSHYDPAVYFIENGSRFVDTPELNDALDRFERLFQDFNALLPKAESVAA